MTTVRASQGCNESTDGTQCLNDQENDCKDHTSLPSVPKRVSIVPFSALPQSMRPSPALLRQMHETDLLEGQSHARQYDEFGFRVNFNQG
ncbi:unnamed protein product [Protopolystoma xenopodis]|uniref:Uncharacterized protein n=1 Tax=Protopolystoma xenopodis TaxID=117903 RepID=A0A3S5CPV2_9PLAT|nr:unnamed protein product [Protopolystoma xenopodis]